MSEIFVEKINGKEVFSSLHEEWQQLFAASNCAPFLSWEWLSVWHEKLAAEREIYLLRIRRNDDLIGILPLCRQNKKVLGLKLRRLGFLGEEIGGADYLDLIAREEDKAEIWPQIFTFLQREKEFSSLELESLAQDSETVSLLEHFGQNDRSFQFRKKVTSVCPQVNLQEGWEDILGHSHRKNNFKRRLKKLQSLEEFEFRSVTAPDEIGQAFERFAVLHEKRWEKEGGSEVTGHPQLMAFHRTVVQRLAEKGLVRFDELWVEGKCRATIYALDNGKIFYYYNAGYDLAWANHSVGLVLVGLSIKNAIERGNTLYDFLRGEENYKFDWANQHTFTVMVTLNQQCLSTLLNENINHVRDWLRDKAKQYLPKKTALKLQNLRRNQLRYKKIREAV
jgi:CelD/BcsL family acetyltransferase involved in cellulose biosynthesis